MKAERIARLLIIVFAIGLPVIAVLARSGVNRGVIEIHAQVADEGGWLPGDLTTRVGEPLQLRLTSDDVVHGFAVGQTEWPAYDVLPGKVTEATLIFDKPGKYQFYCTRWCGPNHWRMRGTIEVTGSLSETEHVEQPLYVTLGLGIDAPHESEVVPVERPSSERGAALAKNLPARYFKADIYRTRMPIEVWRELRADPWANGLDDQQVWDSVAFIWRSNSSESRLAQGARLYAQNCAACHGETGQGDGVMADSLKKSASSSMSHREHDMTGPSDFTDPRKMLGASSAVLHGKMVRGGMGTGMPYWGAIFTDDQLWSLVDYLWAFQFE
jgi:plastocyanin